MERRDDRARDADAPPEPRDEADFRPLDLRADDLRALPEDFRAVVLREAVLRAEALRAEAARPRVLLAERRSVVERADEARFADLRAVPLADLRAVVREDFLALLRVEDFFVAVREPPLRFVAVREFELDLFVAIG